MWVFCGFFVSFFFLFFSGGFVGFFFLVVCFVRVLFCLCLMLRSLLLLLFCFTKT